MAPTLSSCSTLLALHSSIYLLYTTTSCMLQSIFCYCAMLCYCTFSYLLCTTECYTFSYMLLLYATFSFLLYTTTKCYIHSPNCYTVCYYYMLHSPCYTTTECYTFSYLLCNYTCYILLTAIQYTTIICYILLPAILLLNAIHSPICYMLLLYDTFSPS